ncbi:MAG: 4,5-DOPA dioxygenase extradiol [Muribaculaceae bacterium]|jgi:4,5-DOPA dioxygenase extradiol|nr:4,5-DOPA dioxygenase extradiol [Muribaculaceae bacterium]
MKMMPVAFIGHGSPMNAIDENSFTLGWKEMASMIAEPKSILMISAHWFTRGQKVNNDSRPKVNYDMYGFPHSLYKVTYDAPGDPDLASKVMELLPNGAVTVDNSMGYDHGNWVVTSKMFPEHNIPLTQLSVDASASPQEIFHFGELLRPLREEGVLIIASGGIVHNLRMLEWDKTDGYIWADEFDNFVHNKILNKEFDDLVNYEQQGRNAKLSIPTSDHYLPLLYALGATTTEDETHTFCFSRIFGSLSMTSYLWM